MTVAWDEILVCVCAYLYELVDPELYVPCECDGDLVVQLGDPHTLPNRLITTQTQTHKPETEPKSMSAWRGMIATHVELASHLD